MGYDNLKLEKGMYRQEGMSFTQVLESLDPSENYRGTALEEKLVQSMPVMTQLGCSLGQQEEIESGFLI